MYFVRICFLSNQKILLLNLKSTNSIYRFVWDFFLKNKNNFQIFSVFWLSDVEMIYAQEFHKKIFSIQCISAFILSHLTNSQHTTYLLQLFFFHNQNHKFKQQTKKPSHCRMRVCTTSRFSSIGTVPYGSLLFLMLLKWNYALFNSVAQDKNQHQN